MREQSAGALKAHRVIVTGMSSCVTQDGLFQPASQTVKPANLGPKALKTTGQLATTPVRR